MEVLFFRTVASVAQRFSKLVFVPKQVLALQESFQAM